jgi:hypothetical protein
MMRCFIIGLLLRSHSAFTAELDKLDVCKLLTKAEVEETLGEPTGKPIHEVLGAIPNCTWPERDNPQEPILYVIVSHREVSGLNQLINQHQDAFGEEFREDDFEKLNIGDFGVWWKGTWLYVFTKDYQLTIQSGRTMDILPRDVHISLGKMAVSRLPQ